MSSDANILINNLLNAHVRFIGCFGGGGWLWDWKFFRSIRRATGSGGGARGFVKKCLTASIP